ncbi:MAG: hypothetical protein AAFY46_11050, partial [Planctomycetota bacterium]
MRAHGGGRDRALDPRHGLELGLELLVVIKIKSGGGFGLEVQKISDVIHEEFKPKFQTVAWIESAISAAAMSA